MKLAVGFTVNGDRHDILVDPRKMLLDALRDELHLYGTKEGCGNGNCGACTVLLNGRAVNSCLVFAVEAQGQQVVTVEGLATAGQLTPLQQAFLEEGGMQCGFCTPGFLMSATALLKGNPRPTEAEIRVGIAGNLCRCTGYDKIVRAIQKAARASR
jgi:carbon-monoxide dehydrogenase small subunit